MTEKVTIDFIREKISKSDVWTEKAFLRLYNEDEVLDEDKALFEALHEYLQYYEHFVNKHLALLRKKLLSKYLEKLLALAK